MEQHPLVVAIALEWFRASGERTAERLDSLVEHYAFVNAYSDHPETVAHFKRIARCAAGV